MARKTQAFGQKHIALAACALLVLAGCKDPANIGNIQGSNQVRIVGSSTVFPFAKAASERFSHKNLGKANDPVWNPPERAAALNYSAKAMLWIRRISPMHRAA